MNNLQHELAQLSIVYQLQKDSSPNFKIIEIFRSRRNILTSPVEILRALHLKSIQFFKHH